MAADGPSGRADCLPDFPRTLHERHQSVFSEPATHGLARSSIQSGRVVGRSTLAALSTSVNSAAMCQSPPLRLDSMAARCASMPAERRYHHPPPPLLLKHCGRSCRTCRGLMSRCDKAGGNSEQKEHRCGGRCHRASLGEIHGRPLPRDSRSRSSRAIASTMSRVADLSPVSSRASASSLRGPLRGEAPAESTANGAFPHA